MVKLSILGCGSISSTHISRLSVLPEGELEIVGMCDTMLDRAEKLRSHVNGFRNLAPRPLGPEAIFVDYETMLAKAPADAVIICTPHVLHHDHVMRALSHNLHVLVEKPMAVSVREAEDMVSSADVKKRVLAVGYQRHCQPEYLHARQLLSQRELGEVHFIAAWLAQNLFAAGRWYLNPKFSGGGQIKASGTHLIDTILWVTNTEPVKVKALMDRCGEEVDIYSCISAELSNGAIANIAISGGAPGLTTAVQEEVRIWCSRGALFIIDGSLFVQSAKGDVIKVEREKMVEASPNIDVNFVRAIEGKEECLCQGMWGLRATKFEEMAYNDTGSPIPNNLRRG